MTLPQKAVHFAREIVWGTVPGRRNVLRLVSPTSGNTYHLTLQADGTVRCNCPAGSAGRECFHSLALLADYDDYRDAFRDLTRSVTQ
jgi:hypothetical protein